MLKSIIATCYLTVMYQLHQRFNIPPDTPRAFDALGVPGDGKFDSYTYGVGILNSVFDFVKRVPVIEGG